MTDNPLLAAAALEASDDVFVIVDEDATIRYASPACERLVGIAPGDLVGRSGMELLDPMWADELAQDVVAVLTGAETVSRSDAIELHLAGGVVLVDILMHRPQDPSVGALIVQMHPVPRMRLMDQFLEGVTRGRPLDEILDIVMALAVTDTPFQGCALHWDWSEEAGFRQRVHIGVDARLVDEAGFDDVDPPWCTAARTEQAVELASLDEHDDELATRTSAAGFGAIWSFPVKLPTGDRVALTFWRELAGALRPGFRLPVDRVIGLAAMAFEHHLTTEALHHAASHDPLTGAANRTLLEARLLGAMHETDRSDAIFVLDLDGFKAINDVHGHQAGDHVLCTIVERIGGVLRPDDLLARVGGDEFAVACARVTSVDEASAIAQRLLDAVAEPIELDGGTITVGVSIGITLTAGSEGSPEHHLRAADEALLTVKRSTKGTYLVAG